MAAVELRFPPTAGHVRTARLVAVAAARRFGLDNVRLDELRVAVGEACTRALHRCLASGITHSVLLSVNATSHGLTVEVSDWCGDGGRPQDGEPGDQEPLAKDNDANWPHLRKPESGQPGQGSPKANAGRPAAAEDPFVFALLQGLADAVEVLDGPCGPGGLVRLEWWP